MINKIAIDLEGLRKVTNVAVKPLLAKNSKANLLRQQAGLGPIYIVGSRKPIHKPPNSDAVRLANKSIPGYSGAVSAKQKEKINRLVLLHELAEHRARKSKWVDSKTYHHYSPEVILNEGNNLATLKDAAVTNYFSKLREMDKTRQLLEKEIPGYIFGETRLNRHQIKRFTNKIIDKANKRKELGIITVDGRNYRETDKLNSMVRNGMLKRLEALRSGRLSEDKVNALMEKTDRQLNNIKYLASRMVNLKDSAKPEFFTNHLLEMEALKAKKYLIEEHTRQIKKKYSM